MYYFFLGKVLLPVAPSKLTIKINNGNKTYTTINDGEINVLKNPELTDIEFDILLPNVRYDFALYRGKFHNAYYYLSVLEKLKVSKKPFQFICTRQLPNKKNLYSTNIKVSLESYTIKEEAKNGFDVIVSVKLKQYREYGIKKVKVSSASSKKTVSKSRNSSNSPKNGLPTTYKVKSGDCLWKIAKKYYNDGSKYTVIYNANKSKIKKPNLIYPGQVFTIPSI